MFLLIKAIYRSKFYTMPNVGDIYVKDKCEYKPNPWAEPLPTYRVLEVKNGWVRFIRVQEHIVSMGYPSGSNSQEDFNFFFKKYNALGENNE